MSDERKIWARGLTLSSRGSLVKFRPSYIDTGILTGIEHFGDTSVLTLTVSVEVPTSHEIRIVDRRTKE
jgi:hypothetical protein